MRPSRHQRFGLCVAAWLGAWGATLCAQEDLAEAPAAIVHESLEITAVTVPVRVELDGGATAPPLRADEVVVREGGEARRVVSLVRLASAAASAAPPAAPREVVPATLPEPARAARIAVYVDVPMSNSQSLGAAMRRLAGQADELVAAGEVEVVVADPAPATVLAPTRDARRLRDALRELSGRGAVASVVERIRRSVLSGEAGVTRHRDLLRARAAEEVRVVAERRLRLALWAASTPSFGRPRFLFLVSGVYDSDPSDFYLDRLEGGGSGGGSGGAIVRQSVTDSMLLETDLKALRQGRSESDLGSDLAALGWMTFPVAYSDLGFDTFGGADEAGHSRFLAMARGATSPLGGPSAFLFADPLAGWSTVAAPTGGEVLASDKALRDAVRDLGGLYLLTYERSGPAGAAVRTLELESRRPGARLHSLAKVGEATPEGVAALATGALLAGSEPERDLPLVIGPPRWVADGEVPSLLLEIRVDVSDLRAATGAELGRELRLTLALPTTTGSVDVRQQRLAAPPGAPRWHFSLRVRVAPSAERIALRLEDLATGLRGGAVVAVPPRPGSPPPLGSD